MRLENVQYTTRKGIGYGAISGFVAGIAMMLVAMATTVMSGMPMLTIPTAIGLVFGASMKNAVMTGLVMHLITSTIVGIIFGAVVSNVRKLTITGYGKGIGEGLIAAMIAFAVISIPLSMLVMPPVLVKMLIHMHPSMTLKMAMSVLHAKMATNIGAAIVRHLVYGVILGVITTALVLRTQAKKDTYQ
ncbi:MAG: hypothetical protein KGI27_04800 [Thaumarchaeota archaeon]|nr:hypothetical protein [Nitrososphaerota archaeon]